MHSDDFWFHTEEDYLFTESKEAYEATPYGDLIMLAMSVIAEALPGDRAWQNRVLLLGCLCARTIPDPWEEGIAMVEQFVWKGDVTTAETKALYARKPRVVVPKREGDVQGYSYESGAVQAGSHLLLACMDGDLFGPHAHFACLQARDAAAVETRLAFLTDLAAFLRAIVPWEVFHAAWQAAEEVRRASDDGEPEAPGAQAPATA